MLAPLPTPETPNEKKDKSHEEPPAPPPPPPDAPWNGATVPPAVGGVLVGWLEGVGSVGGAGVSDEEGSCPPPGPAVTGAGVVAPRLPGDVDGAEGAKVGVEKFEDCSRWCWCCWSWCCW